MGKKHVNYDFFVLKYPDHIEGNVLDAVLLKEESRLNKSEVDISQSTFRIGEMVKKKRKDHFATMDNNYYWVASIERINTDEESYVGKKGSSG